MSADAIYLSQLLMTKVSHDLAGMAGSVLNGIELFEETEDREMLALSKESAKSFISRVKYYRATLGLDGAFVNAHEVRTLMEDFVATFRHITVDFKIESADSKTLRLALILVMLACETFTRGGVIVVEISPTTGALKVLAHGEQLQFSEEMLAAVGGEISELSAKFAPALYSSFLAILYRKKISVDVSPHVVAFKAL